MRAYVARHAGCGKVVTVMVDGPEHKKETAKEVAGWIRRGDAVESMPVGDVPDAEYWCSCWQKEGGEGKGG